jgi:hypothetical protein
MLAAAAVAAGIAACALAALLAYLYLNKPAIDSISPSIGERGDVLTVSGRHFGEIQGDSCVMLGGIKPTASSYLSWTDTLIKVSVPETADSGLVYVRGRRGRSNALLFTNREQVPVLFRGTQSGSTPTVTGLSISSAPIGALITVTGLNFGINQEESRVLFSAARDTSNPETPGSEAREYLANASSDSGYELWSDKEIRVIVPDGAASGPMAIATARGTSNTLYFEVTGSPGQKIYKNKRTYVIRYSAEISRIKASGANSIFLWIPRPLESASQRAVKAIQSSEKPTIENFRGLMLYHFKDSHDGQSLKVQHDFILSSYEIESQPKVDAIKSVDKDSPIRAAFTKAEPEIPSTAAAVAKTAAEIVGKEKNPWRQAKLVYDWTLDKVTLRPDKNSGNALSALSELYGDAYSISMLYVALCRALGIPCAPVSGVWIDSARATHPHWWAEFFVDGMGWVPVDPAFGSSAPSLQAARPPQKEGFDRRAYYFGNVDNDRIMFSRGFATLSSQAPNSRLKPHGRFYSLQTITEEASASVESYASFWSDIEITGVY